MDVYLEEIESIVTAASTDVGDGTSFPIFLGHLPDSTTAGVPDRAIALVLGFGDGDYGRVEIEQPGLQVIVRGPSITEISTGYEEAYGIAHMVKNALHGYTGAPSTDSKNYVGIWNESGPFFVGFDESMRPNFSNNFRVMRSRT